METKVITNTKLGLFVTAGLAFMILTLYMIGRNRNLLGSTFTISVRLENVNGLLPGNNVRFRGVDVGTVKEVTISDGESIVVDLTIRKKYQPYIKQNSIASIGTDGLMGNKLVNINSPAEPAPPIKENSSLTAMPSIETDQMLRTLHATNNSIALITRNLEQITYKLNRNNSLWALLGDTSIASDLKLTVNDVHAAGVRIASFTGKAEELISDLRAGRGTAGAFLTDTAWRIKLTSSIENIERASGDLPGIVQNMNQMVDQIYHGPGTTSQLINDTVTRKQLSNILSKTEEGTARFSENMEALKHNFLFKRYFKKREKKRKKIEQASLNGRVKRDNSEETGNQITDCD